MIYATTPSLTLPLVVEGDHNCALWDSSWRLEIVDSGDHKGELTALAFSDDATWLATGGGPEDCTVRIWVAADGQHFDTLEGHERAVRLLAFSPDGKLVVSGSDDGIVRVWGVREGNIVAILGPHDKDIKGAKLFFSDDGAEVFLRTSLTTTSWSIAEFIDRDALEEAGTQQELRQAGTERPKKEPPRFTFPSLGRVPSRNSMWFVRFEGAGQQKEVAITAPGVLADGPIAYCRDRLAICRENGKFLLLDISKVIKGMNLPNFSWRQVTHITSTV